MKPQAQYIRLESHSNVVREAQSMLHPHAFSTTEPAPRRQIPAWRIATALWRHRAIRIMDAVHRMVRLIAMYRQLSDLRYFASAPGMVSWRIP